MSVGMNYRYMARRVRARGLQAQVGRVPSRGNIAHLCNQALAQNLFHDVPVHVGQTALNAVVIKREFSVIEPEQAQNRSVEIVSGDGIFGGVETDFIRSAVT